MNIIKYCQSCFDVEMPSVLWAKRANKLNEKCLYCDNMFVPAFVCLSVPVYII